MKSLVFSISQSTKVEWKNTLQTKLHSSCRFTNEQGNFLSDTQTNIIVKLIVNTQKQFDHSSAFFFDRLKVIAERSGY